MGTETTGLAVHPEGEQPEVEAWSAVADTYAGRVHVEWDATAPVTPFGQLPFFVEYLKQGGLFDGWVADCPLSLTSPNAPRKRDLLGTVLLSVLAGHRRYAHITALRCDPMNPPLLGMRKVLSEDAVRRNLGKVEEAPGLTGLQGHLDYSVAPLLDEPWVLDVDTTIKPLYGEQEGAELGYNPHKPGRPPHSHHTYMLSNLRLVLSVDVQPGDQHNVKHATGGLWSLLDRWDRGRWPTLLRGDLAWGIEPVMAQAERRNLAYLFRLRTTKNVSRALQRAMAQSDWSDAGQGWQGKETRLRLEGWSRQRRVILLRRQLKRPLAIVDHGDPAQPRLGRGRAGSAGLGIRCIGDLARQRDPDARSVVSRSGRLREHVRRVEEPMGLGRLHHDDLKRCRLLARSVALIYNWWSLFVRLADPEHHREAITSRPLLLTALARRTHHAGQVTLTVSSAHGEQHLARRAYLRIAGFMARLRQSAEQLDALERWYRILSEALRHYLHGRQL